MVEVDRLVIYIKKNFEEIFGKKEEKENDGSNEVGDSRTTSEE